MKEKIFGDIETMILFLSIIGATIAIATSVNIFLNRAVRRTLKRMDADMTNYVFLRHFVVGLIYLVGIGWAFLVLPTFKTVAHTLLTGAGIVAIVAGLASQQALSNITSGLFMVIFKPFRVNDRISIRGTMTGTVEDITLRHTIIRDMDNNRIIIPNSVLGNEIIVNTNLADTTVCRKIDIGIGYSSDIDRALGIMREEVLKHPLHIVPEPNSRSVSHDPDVFTQILSLSESSVVLRVWAWTNSENDAIRMEGDLLKSIKARFDEEGIEIPFPQRVVSFKNFPSDQKN
ncbi:MAG: mechanosensitive ion channel family protein [Lewinellaceae bacterium]|nr:mechanosensitive ion channel family protein [Saprospiraceae bacterium]MCB9341931.1 mechanosensitive ion channel family protein [Lewinellaceae bacterium]